MRYRVLVHHPVGQELETAAASCSGQAEAGGVLLGAYRGADMEVTGLTRPGPMDQRRLYSFTRTDPLHDAANRLAWERSGGTVSYVGEWHSHPSGRVTPSSLDLGTWRSEARRCARPMVFVLVVPGQWALFLVRPRWPRPAVARLSRIEFGKVGAVHA